MTVSNQTNRISAVGSGAIGQEVAIAFPYNATSDLVVISRVTATGVETTLIETTNYTLTAASESGGTLTTVTAVAATAEIHIIRDTPNTQVLDLEQGGSFNAENIEDALDKSIKLTIENTDTLDRSLVFPKTDPTASITDLPTSIDRAGKYLYFDASTGAPTPATLASVGSATISTFGATLIDDASAAASRNTLGLYADVKGHGAKGDNVTDDTAAFQAAIDTGLNVYIPKTATGYKIDGTLTISTHGQKMFGDSSSGATPYSLLIGDTTNDPIVQVSAWYVSLEDFAVQNAVTGIAIGTVGPDVKAGNPILTNIRTKDCTTAGVHAVYGNSGRVYGFTDSGSGKAFWLEDNASSGLGVTDDPSAWFFFGARAKSATTGFEIGTNNNYFVGSTESCNTGLIYKSTALRNFAWLHDDRGAVGITQVPYNNEGSRNNHCMLTGTNAASGTMSGWWYGTAPVQYMLDEMITNTATEAMTGTEEATLIGFQTFTTVTNTDSAGILNITKLDSIDNESQSKFFYFPAANTYQTTVVLNDPATYTFLSTNQTDSTKYKVFVTGTAQLFEMTYVGDSKFSFREVGGELPYNDNTITSTATLAVDTQLKHNTIITFTNAGASYDYTLSDWDDCRVGHTVYIYKGVTTGNVVLKITDGTFPDATTQVTLMAGTEYAIKLTKLVTGATSIVGYETLNGSSETRTDTIAVSNAEIQALAATPKELVVAQGADRYIEFVGATLILDYATAAIDDAAADGNLIIGYIDESGIAASQDIEADGFIDMAADTITNAIPKKDAITAAAAESVNKALVLYNDAAEYTVTGGGAGVVRVKITYRVHTLGL